MDGHDGTMFPIDRYGTYYLDSLLTIRIPSLMQPNSVIELLHYLLDKEVFISLLTIMKCKQEVM